MEAKRKRTPQGGCKEACATVPASGASLKRVQEALPVFTAHGKRGIKALDLARLMGVSGAKCAVRQERLKVDLDSQDTFMAGANKERLMLK